MGSFDASKDEKANLLKGMDKTMAQKLAFTSAHFQLSDGARILDVGCGTGYGSYQFALYNPHLQVVALDYDRDYIERARDAYKLPNLTFVQGDARNFDTGGKKFDAIFNSSILHEVYSFSGYSQQAVTDSLHMQMSNVRDGGIILIRDFVRPDHPDAMVYLDLPVTRNKSDNINDLSTPDMLRLYAQWACAEKAQDQRGFFLEELKGDAPKGWQRFYLSHDWANEFILRKDYRDRFYIEAKEKYGYFTPREYREIPEKLGARVLYTSPYYNPWIMENRMQGKLRLFNENLRDITLPPTNFVCVMQKVPADKGVILHEHKVSGHELTYLKSESYKHRATKKIHGLVSRPGDVFDIVPYYVHADGRVDVYARSDYPRPLVNVVSRQMSQALDGKTWSGYMVEPFAVANQQGDIMKAAACALQERAGITQIKNIAKGPEYYPALNGVNERVGAVFVELSEAISTRDLSPGHSGFTENGQLRAFNLQDMMRGIQVGMFPEARLELCAYRLAQKLDIAPPAWMGQRYNVRAAALDEGRGNISPLAKQLSRSFSVSKTPANDIMGVRSVFVEKSAGLHGAQILAQRELEFVVPARQGKYKGEYNLSCNLAVITPVTRSASGALMIGLKKADYPALQVAGENASLETLQVTRLPSRIKTTGQMMDFVADQCSAFSEDVMSLGEGYFPSMGITPERAHPLLVRVRDFEDFRDYHFVPVAQLMQKIDSLRDAHLMLAVYRLSHAFDQWPKARMQASITPPAP